MELRETIKGISVGLLVVALIVSLACKAPAKFEVLSLDITPPEVRTGEETSITAKITNIGGSEVTYTAALIVDGTEVGRKNVTLPAGTTKTVSFSLAKDTPGTYKISIGERSSNLMVKEKLVTKEAELKYDDGKPDGTWAIGGLGRGHLVRFSPPFTPFTIAKVKIFGSLYGTGYENRTFLIQVWDKDLKEIHSASYQHTKFSSSPGWIEIEIPKVVLMTDFYIFVGTNSPREGGVQIFYDSSVKNEHSEVTERWKIANWYLRTPKEEVNWTVRAVGTFLAPEK